MRLRDGRRCGSGNASSHLLITEVLSTCAGTQTLTWTRSVLARPTVVSASAISATPALLGAAVAATQIGLSRPGSDVCRSSVMIGLSVRTDPAQPSAASRRQWVKGCRPSAALHPEAPGLPDPEPPDPTVLWTGDVLRRPPSR